MSATHQMTLYSWIRPSVCLYIHVCKCPRNEMRNASLYSAVAPLYFCSAAAEHIQPPTLHQSPPSIWAPHPPTHPRILSLWGPAAPFITSSTLPGGTTRALCPSGCEHTHLPHTPFLGLSLLPCQRCQSLWSLAKLVIPCCSTLALTRGLIREANWEQLRVLHLLSNH